MASINYLNVVCFIKYDLHVGENTDTVYASSNVKPVPSISFSKPLIFSILSGVSSCFHAPAFPEKKKIKISVKTC